MVDFYGRLGFDGRFPRYRNCFGQRPAEAAADASTAMMFRFAAHVPWSRDRKVEIALN